MCLLTCFSRGKDGLAPVCPQPHPSLLATSDTFARLYTGPTRKHLTQVEVLAILILERKWPGFEGSRQASPGPGPQPQEQKRNLSKDGENFSYLPGFLLLFLLCLSSAQLRTQEKNTQRQKGRERLSPHTLMVRVKTSVSWLMKCQV